MIKRLFFVTVLVSTAQAMVFDNRFLPLLLKPFTRRCDALSHVRVQPFFMHADRAFSDGFRLSIPDIEGVYDQRVLARALVATGHEEPLRSDFRSRTSIPWRRRGRLDAQGLAFLYEQALTDWLSVGFDALFAHISMRHEFLLRGPEGRLPEGDRNYLFSVKDKMHRDLGVTPALFSHTGFGDIDFYFRIGKMWHYTLKFRRIDAGFKMGILAPTAKARNLKNPAAIPLGGDKHWGIYGDLHSEWEFKEDLSAGLMLRASKRFEKTRTMRMPLLNEPTQYGAIVGPVRVDPGWTFVFNPYVSLSGLRRGFGLKALYTLVAHLNDTFSDKRPASVQRRLPSRLAAIESCSSWGAEHVSVGAYYDFGRVWDCPTLYPKISAYWDIPVNWLVSKRASKTNSVSLMVEFDF